MGPHLRFLGLLFIKLLLEGRQPGVDFGDLTLGSALYNVMSLHNGSW